MFSVVCTIVLAWWPISPLWSRVYSPYQLVEIGTDGDTGLTLIRAAGHYYQGIRDLRGQSADNDYFNLPFQAHPVLNDSRW